jgi:hypothetical protein
VNFKLERSKCSADGVFGEITSEDGQHSFFTLEHAYPDGNGGFVPKVAAGTYICTRYASPDHGYEVFVLQNVPDFQGQPVSYIELHIGCFNKDSKGCILLGEIQSDTMILKSQIAFEAFMQIQNEVGSWQLIIT